MKGLQGLREDFVEILLITKVCLTSFWFWLPAVFAAYMYFQLWMMFIVHPLTILIVPFVLAIFAMVFEEERAKAQYGLDKIKLLKASDPLGANPTWKEVRLDVEKAIRDFQESVRKTEEKKTRQNG